jgi:molybdopterin synthase sulfur carrier subunit
MSTKVRIPTLMRPNTGGYATVVVDGATVGEVIANLVSTYPGLAEILLSDGVLHRFVNVYVNDDDVRYTGAMLTALSEGDEITILPAVAGGFS